MKSFDIFHLVLCRLSQVETIILISNFSAKPWLTLQRLENLRPAQAISLWSQGAKEGVPAVAQQKCFSSGVFNLPTRPCWKLLGSVQKACYLPGAELHPWGKIHTSSRTSRDAPSDGPGQETRTAPTASNEQPSPHPASRAQHTPTFGAAEALQAKPEAGTEQVHRPQPRLLWAGTSLWCKALGPSVITPREAAHHPSSALFWSNSSTIKSHVSRKAGGAHGAKFVSLHLSWYETACVNSTAHLQDCQPLEMVQGSCHSNLSITHYCPSRFCKMSAQAKSLHPLILK